ncbi:uncharacterized protein K02A2.6-like [Saccostrea cucullata]|uniref:uncharacterized protein K02A2.6-like n=1 Tax=Saccostrea cuccullata TaxID=36930 RepID=UPI002ED29B8F
MDCEYTNPDDLLIDAIIAGIRHVKPHETSSLDEGVLHIYSAQDDSSVANDKWVVKATINKPVKFRKDTGEKSSIIVKSVFDLDLTHRLARDTETGYGDRLSTNVQMFKDFPELIKTSGTLPGEHNIEIDPDAEEVIHAPRRQPASLKPKIIDKLKEMEQNDYITKVNTPTEWVSSMVVSLRNDKIRICLDQSDLNKVVKRAHHPMKTVEDIVSNIPNARVFSKVDAKSGFLQIKLNEKFSYLTTFITPIGRYRCFCLPFGIKFIPEIFQHIMDQMLEGIDGAAAVMDDILIGGRDVEQHDQIFRKVTERASQYNLKLNYDKCEIR